MTYRFENMIACHLLKWCYYQQDTAGREAELRYFRDTDRREVDFVLLEDEKPIHFIECKLSDRQASPPLRYLKQRFATVPATQVILSPGVDVTNKDDIRICSADIFLDMWV